VVEKPARALDVSFERLSPKLLIDQEFEGISYEFLNLERSRKIFGGMNSFMVIIRLARAGRKGTAVFKIMVANARDKVKGRFLEKIGLYKPAKTADEKTIFDVNKERYAHWVSKGAQPTPRMKLLMKTLGENKAPKQRKAKPKAKAEAAAPAAG
jgi:small subunit ribosomal protein S16